MDKKELEDDIKETEKLFVYGIFLGEHTRQGYGMTNPRYATVKDYVTFGGHIVEARHKPGYGFSLSGLIVDVPEESWYALDKLEGGYDRIRVTTSERWAGDISGEEVWMYVAKQ